MTTTRSPLDAAFDRLGRWGFDDPDGFVNHGPMVCEALHELGRFAEVDSWSRQVSGTPPVVVVHPTRFDWTDAIGDLSRTGEWMGYFERSIADEGWSSTLHTWLPRLLPGLGVALFHGAIRTAHAARAVEDVASPSRCAELARSLGYWAGLFEAGAVVDERDLSGGDEPRRGVVEAAAGAAHHYLAKPNIFGLHGVTAAMAVSILVRHVDTDDAVAALAQLRAEHAVLYRGVVPRHEFDVQHLEEATLVEAAVQSGDAHAVKLVEACRRGLAATGDEVFLAAAERVTRRAIRTLGR
ncbi:MAG: DUF4243 domain-containing protein [Acidimicrobiales bacterium]|nr:DUF4243 domain-containing protein [Acidimicrobiales bacterium]MCB9395657.1 DUF4243 domain-containing protein [Acidimicrobiaceae bacterium]